MPSTEWPLWWALGLTSAFLVAVRLCRRPPDAKRTFGYMRLEAMGAMVNGLMILLVARYIPWEAVGRFTKPMVVGTHDE